MSISSLSMTFLLSEWSQNVCLETCLELVTTPSRHDFLY